MNRGTSVSTSLNNCKAMEEPDEPDRKRRCVTMPQSCKPISQVPLPVVVVTAVVILVGWHSLNPRNEGHIDIPSGTEVVLNTDPLLFCGDKHAVNVVVASGTYEGRHLGHIATHCTAPIKNLMWGHFFSALINGDCERLPEELCGLGIEKYLTFSGTMLEKSTHHPKGSKVAVEITSNSLTEQTMEMVVKYLRSAEMINVTLVVK